MNIHSLFDGDTELIGKAFDELHGSVGIEGKFLDDVTPGADATVLLNINGKQLRYDCQVKKKVDRYTLLLDLLTKTGDAQHTLLISSPLSQEMANRCRELGLQFIDTAGNAYINDGAGIYIHVTGLQSKEPRHASINSTMTPVLLRMMFGFLADPALLNAPYRDIAYKVRVSTGAIGRAFETLETRRLIGTTATGKRMIRTPELFLNEWAGGYAGRLKPKLRKYRFATDNFDRFLDWSPEFRSSAWGGEPAAMRLTQHLKPEAGTLYVDMHDPGTLKEIVKEFRLRADPQGRIEVVEIFWDADSFDWFPTVPSHLVYADLMATHDSRNIAVARQIASQVIDHVHATSR